MKRKSTKDDLAREHIPLVKRLVAIEMTKLGFKIDRDELYSYAMEGLAIAIERFEPERNIRFATFAAPRIRGSIYDGLSKSNAFPRRLRRKINFYRKTDEMLKDYSQSPAPADKIETVNRLANTLKDLATAYVTTYAADNENEEAVEHANVEYSIDRKKYNKKLIGHICELPEKQKKIIMLYFFEGKTMEQVGDELNVSKSWISKLLKSALKQLRQSFDAPLPLPEDYNPI